MGERGKTEAMEGQRDRAKESKTERMEKEWRNVMRHCVAVQRGMNKAETKIRLIEWTQTELTDETSRCCGSE